MMKVQEIQDILLKEYFPKGRKWCTTNFCGLAMQEMDIIMISKSYMVYEYEVKCSYTDFKADFRKKYKHRRLANTEPKHIYKSEEWNKAKDLDEQYIKSTGYAGRPNYFYYICKEGLIPLEEVPEYAGLCYIIGESVEIIKKAPKLHKHKANQKLIEAICQSNTAKLIYGCSYMNYKQRKNESDSSR